MAENDKKFVAPRPGSDQQCTAINTGRYRPERKGERCTNWRMPGGGEFCASHRDWGDRRCKGVYSANHEKAGQQCVQVAMNGQKYCEKHGGMLQKPRLVAAAKEAKLQARMVKILQRYDVDTTNVDNPLEALKALAVELFDHKELMRAYVNKLEGEIRYESKAGGEQLRAEMALYERAMDRCVGLLASIAKLNIDERLAKIEEAKIMAILNAIDTGINRAAVAGEQAVTIRREIAGALREASAS